MYLLLFLVLLTLADRSQGVSQTHDKSLTVSTLTDASAGMKQPAIPKPKTNLTQNNNLCCCKGKGAKAMKAPCPCQQHRRKGKNGKPNSLCKKKNNVMVVRGPSSPL
ncbi:hypothetical protein Q5P01_011465 [Channa striata]|uniref:Uncharacterized protein n=1 Tax=Channa striata TaxID=64152 RepID=A0AA88MTA2_CHASR|nr:hypothetical protein Q5P01_011465 [Channa striata]